MTNVLEVKKGDCVGRRAGEKPVQFSLSAAATSALDVAASYHKGDVERDRPMNKGPMLAYVSRWFLSLPREDQLQVIQEGKALVERDVEGEEIPPFGARFARASVELSTTHVPIYGKSGSENAVRRGDARARKK